jgi:hypothetical protein
MADNIAASKLVDVNQEVLDGSRVQGGACLVG